MTRTIMADAAERYADSAPAHSGQVVVPLSQILGDNCRILRASDASRTAAAMLMALVLVLVSSTAASAQSSIAGVVRDGSGAPLPGVTVEASSPVLLEKTRTSLTDSSGQFAIVDLHPGVFSLTFTLAGFTPVTRTGVELTGAFVATVSVELSVRGRNETVHVTADIPSIDGQSTHQHLSMT